MSATTSSLSYQNTTGFPLLSVAAIEAYTKDLQSPIRSVKEENISNWFYVTKKFNLFKKNIINFTDFKCGQLAFKIGTFSLKIY